MFHFYEAARISEDFGHCPTGRPVVSVPRASGLRLIEDFECAQQRLKPTISGLPTNLGTYLIVHCRSQLRAGNLPDEFALSNALKASGQSKSATHSKLIHALVVKSGLCGCLVLMTSLMDLKLKCGDLEDAQKLFDELPTRDVVSWTSMVVGFAKNELYMESLRLFQSMIARGVIPNKYTFSGALTACLGLQDLRICEQIHAKVTICTGFSTDTVLQNCLLNAYCKCGALDRARMLFDLMPMKSNIAWNELICGYLQNGEGEEALKLFVSMVSQGEKPDDFSYAIGANACAEFASIRQGVQLHARVVKSGFESELVTANSLIDMYAKVGCVNSAKLIFYKLPTRDAKLCTAMISALGKCGLAEECFMIFNQMQEWDVKPDGITYLAILSACSHRGMEEQCWSYFQRMIEEDQIPAMPVHYSCIVDLLCRNGSLARALEFIKEMPLEPNVAVWTAFLNACQLHRHLEFAQIASRHLLELSPQNHSNHVVLSNMLAAENDWEWTETIREKKRSINLKKQPGCSWIELSNGVRVLLTADTSLPEVVELLRTLNTLVIYPREEEPSHRLY
ncbi:hypothetical protein H6P81_007469 [Aristolochia fimbriata]|uniref:Pentatricopeptide repeat-containing protein n=1 Tax=Aristolochia fimbriata TaxID=158543 RepID=A0AAV7F0A7_ARIFI|nr:hypothetical protein H6P81_007469 [Aristolochia fimbriata]